MSTPPKYIRSDSPIPLESAITPSQGAQGRPIPEAERGNILIGCTGGIAAISWRSTPFHTHIEIGAASKLPPMYIEKPTLYIGMVTPGKGSSA